MTNKFFDTAFALMGNVAEDLDDIWDVMLSPTANAELTDLAYPLYMIKEKADDVAAALHQARSVVGSSKGFEDGGGWAFQTDVGALSLAALRLCQRVQELSLLSSRGSQSNGGAAKVSQELEKRIDALLGSADNLSEWADGLPPLVISLGCPD